MADILRDGEAAAGSPQYRTLLAVADAVASHHELPALLADLAARLRQVLPCEDLCLRLHDAASNTLRVHLREVAAHLPTPPAADAPLVGHPAGWVWQTQQPLVVADLAGETRWTRLPDGERGWVRSLCVLPLTTARGRLGVLAFGCTQAAAYDSADVGFLRPVANLVALAFEHLRELKDGLEEESRGECDFEEVIGESDALRRVLDEVKTVAPTASTVLIQGETGTGKELVAHALHRLSPRRAHAFIKVNCAAIPTGLLESELFGHEKGAFTGAIAQKVGRFELADGGTLFLDEVGDIPPELQPKLLRVLQEREFERLGSSRTQRVDVRLVAATNRDLARLVAEGLFRGDLYYRLNVFPVLLPPLRERREDIPRLARHFTERFARRMGKRIETIPAGVMDLLMRYPWPGNIRELENVIERAVILCKAPALQVVLGDVPPAAAPAEGPAGGAVTLAEAEREQILRALRDCNGVVGGPHGAAARLGVPRSTLLRKMKQHGISRTGWHPPAGNAPTDGRPPTDSAPTDGRAPGGPDRQP